MTSKFLRFSLAAAAFCAISALAQTGTAAPPSGSAAAPANPAPASSVPNAPSSSLGATTSTRVGTININDAIVGSNEGRRDIEALSKKYEPRQNELKSQNDELDGLKKQLQTQQDKLNDDARATLQKQIETKQKVFDRAVQDFQEEAGNQQQEVANKILQKMAPLIVKYAQDNGFAMIVDTSKPWPQSPVLWWGKAVDITEAVVEAYNVQSGVPAPASTTGAAKPPASRPATGTGSGTTPKPPASKPADPPK